MLIKNCELLDVIGEKILSGRDLRIEDGKIATIGKNIDPLEGEEVIDGKDFLVTPGFINAHTHLGMSLLRNLADDVELHTWLNQEIWPFEGKMNPKDIYWGTKLSLGELIASGVTCYCDQYYGMDLVGEATLEAGIRGVLCRGLIEDDQKREKLEETQALYDHYHGREQRLRVVPSPHAIYMCSGPYLKEIIAMAKSMDGMINIHMSETKKEVEDCLAEHGVTPIEYIHSLGMLDLHVIAAHCVHMTSEEMNLVQDKAFYPVYNPTSNLKLASGFTPVQEMVKKNITIALGTDGSSSNNNQNIVEEMHIGSIVNKGITGDATAISAMEMLKMATINGAKALGWDKVIGSIEEGKAADLVFFNLRSSSFVPRNNLISALTYSAQASDIAMTMCDGKIIYRNGEHLTLNMEEIYDQVQQRTDRIVEELKGEGQ